MLKNENFANIAKTFAAKHVVGEKANADYMEMLKYYRENDPHEFKHGCCCASFYHFGRKAAINLPLGTHKTARKGHFRWFTSAIAWFEWAQVNGFIQNESPGFTPERGDIVIYNNIVPEP